MRRQNESVKTQKVELLAQSRERIRQRRLKEEARRNSVEETPTARRVKVDAVAMMNDLMKKDGSVGNRAKDIALQKITREVITDATGHVDLLSTPEKVPAGMTRDEWLEQKAASCEMLMLQGVRDNRLLCKMLDLPRPTVDIVTRRVLARWEVLGGNNDLRGAKGESVAHLDMIVNELWSIYRGLANEEKNNSKAFQKSMVLGQILGVVDRKMNLQGLSQTNIQMLLSVSDDSEVVQRMRQHQAFGELASRLLDKIKLRRMAAEADITILPEEKTAKVKALQ